MDNTEQTPFGLVKYEEGELAKWDESIENAAKILAKNRNEAESFARDAVTFLYSSEKNIEQLKSKNVFQRVWGNITGSNAKLRDESQHNLAKAQHQTLKLLSKLGEQNALLMDSIVALTNYAGYLHTENKRIRVLILEALTNIRDRFLRNENDIQELKDHINRIDRTLNTLQDDVNIHAWVLSIDGADYLDTKPKAYRLLKMIRDFSEAKNSFWTSKDLIQFRSALVKCGFKRNEMITIKSFIIQLLDDTSSSKTEEIRKSLSLEKGKSLMNVMDLPILYPVEATTDIVKNIDKYDILNVVIEKAKMKGANIDEKDCLIDITLKHLQENGINIDENIEVYDLAVDLLHSKKLIDNHKSLETKETNLIVKDKSNKYQQEMERLKTQNINMNKKLRKYANTEKKSKDFEDPKNLDANEAKNAVAKIKNVDGLKAFIAEEWLNGNKRGVTGGREKVLEACRHRYNELIDEDDD